MNLIDHIQRLRFNKPIRRGAIAALTIVLLILVSSNSTPALDAIRERGELRVGIRPGAMTYFERDSQPDGLDYHLVKAFADDLGVELTIVEMTNISELLNSIGGPRVDMAAASLTITPERAELYQFSRPYMEVTSTLVQHTSQSSISSPDQLVGRDILVIENSSHAEALQALQQKHPQIRWREEPDLIMFELMQRVNDEEIELTVVDSSAYELDRSFFQRIKATLDLDEPSGIGWAFQASEDSSLVDAANKFLDQYEARGQLAQLLESFFGKVNRLAANDTLVFTDRLGDRLPKFERLFKLIAEREQLDWLLLAAIAYQESHWDPQATSPTGVRGMMMLTLPTAEQMGIGDRLDPLQSLDGGARYFKLMRDKIPDRIREPDRTRFALAAYNIGYGHLEDARVLAQRLGKNPDRWEDVREALPLLQKQEHYSKARYGYARGAEAQAYVDNIFKYYNVLQWHVWRNGINSGESEEIISDEDFRRLLEADFRSL